MLLGRLFSIRVNRKTWHVIRNWYKDGRSSPTFPVERGVRQWSVLLPTLFLRSMEAAGLEYNIYGGAYLHAYPVWLGELASIRDFTAVAVLSSMWVALMLHLHLSKKHYKCNLQYFLYCIHEYTVNRATLSTDTSLYLYGKVSMLIHNT